MIVLTIIICKFAYQLILTDQHFNKCKFMKTQSQIAEFKEELNFSVSTFIDAHDLFSCDYSVETFYSNCDLKHAVVSIYAREHLVSLSRLCCMFNEEFDSELHVSPSFTNEFQIEFWFLYNVSENE